jgi:hypothetical protein
MDLCINCLDCHYVISSSELDASFTQRRLDLIASDLLARTWEDRISHDRGDDDAMYFIERMEVNLALDLSSGDDRALAETWAHALHKGIFRTLRQHDNHIIVFRDRAEFIASFLGDLLRGYAWKSWYYREFEHLRALSPGQAALKVLSEDGDTGRDALMELTRRDELDLLLARLTDTEVETIVSQCLLPPGPTVAFPNRYPGWVQSLRALLSGQRLTLTSMLARDLARLYLGLLRQHPELGPDVHLARFIRDLLRLRQQVMELTDSRTFLRRVASENWTAALGQLGRGSGQQLLATFIRAITGPEVVALLQDLQAETPQAILSRVSTPYGGLFLLVPTIVEMEFYNFLQACPYPEPQDMPKAGLLLFVIALQCLGRQHVQQAQHDGGLALFAGLPAPPALSQLERYTKMLTPGTHQTFIRTFQAHQTEITNRPGFFRLPQSMSSEVTDTSGWLSLCAGTEPFLSDREWDDALGMVSFTLLRRFASKLGAFAESSPAYLCRNFLESHAEIEVFADHITVHLRTCPLQVVLRMAGFDHNTWTVPWLENRKLEFHFD